MCGTWLSLKLSGAVKHGFFETSLFSVAQDTVTVYEA